MQSFRNLVARGALASRSLADDGSSDHVITIMIALLSLTFFGLLLLALLFLLRRLRQQQQMRNEVLPQYNDVKHDVRRTGNHRRLTIQTHDGRSSVVVFKDGQPMLANPSSPPHSPDNVPEIHITFPEEEDEYGRKQSGRVVVVRVGDNASVGLEPLHDEQLPAYERESKTQFYSIDIDQIGGLKEKERSDYH
ncbi:hypothetical protein NKR23_g2205 [Pleurostoma richardsiae]|jgi:hypothetical protein|uniref:Uncharacterized protein n=1 Tax=Pleurostoma richardsiae TaxID=41990 RepID=A0AA38VIH8_9PEZI|nr:hypothetical protein NKR23_g2205 [Pleurostoma richardsiae]